MPTVRAATLNLRNIADRWPERLPLLLADMAALRPDVIGLQECVFAVQQDRVLGSAGDARYASFRGSAGRPEYGNAILVREGVLTASAKPERLELGHNRSALWVPLRLTNGGSLAYVVTHLHHLVPDESLREEQASTLVAWLDAHPDPAIQVVVGDFNAEPVEAAYGRMVQSGFRSAYAETYGHEPEVTWPSGIQAPGMDTDGDPGCLDYIWLRGGVRAASARLAFDRPAVGDPTLYPSDHFGLVAELTFDA
jgi:endonuclease/exonuclease/phosphatase family metal-dependent hydrolase